MKSYEVAPFEEECIENLVYSLVSDIDLGDTYLSVYQESDDSGLVRTAFRLISFDFIVSLILPEYLNDFSDVRLDIFCTEPSHGRFVNSFFVSVDKLYAFGILQKRL